MATKRKSYSTGGSILIALCMLLVFLLSGGLTFYFTGGLAALGVGPAPFAAPRTPAGPGYVAGGQVRALQLAAPSDTGEAAMAAYFEAAVAFAQANGLNTIIFEAGGPGGVWWRDDTLPAAVSGRGADGGAPDPLGMLCAAADGALIQLLVQLDVTTGGDAAGAVDALSKLEQPLAGLPRYYPVTGIVLGGFLEGVQTGDAERADYALAFEKLLQNLASAYEEQARTMRCGIRFSPESGLMDTGFAQNLAQKGLAAWLLPLPGAGDTPAPTNLGGAPTIHASSGNPLSLFFAAQNAGFAGAVLARLPGAQPADTQLLAGVLDAPDRTPPASFDIPRTLAVTYPAGGAEVNTAGIFLMGTSDPTLPLYFDGTEVETRAPSGSFGIFVELASGENSFVFSQDGIELPLTVIRGGGSSGGGSGGGGGTGGGTRRPPPAKAGEAVRISSVIGTAYTANGGINETFPLGATFIVEEAMSTTDGGSYRLKSGDYVPASFCEAAEGGGSAAFTGLAVAPQPDGSELVTFEGSGTPAAYVAYGDADGTLTLTFYDTSFSLAQAPGGTLLTGAAVHTDEATGATVLTLQTSGIWGYSLEYADGGTSLWLMAPPARSATPGRPLEGVRILLDPGHGADDMGSPGLMWDRGPHEKQVNLALAQAIAYRLRQLGAEVALTREDDSFPTLQDRLAAQTLQKPHFFLSVHHNALEPTADLNGAAGVEAYYYHPYTTPPSRQFAQNLLDHIAAGTGRNPRKVDWNYFYVTRTTVCPSVLFEYGFLMNPTEYEDVTSDAGIWAAAFSTADAILATLPA